MSFYPLDLFVYPYLRDEHKCLLKPHDDPERVTLRQLPGKGLGAFLEGIRFASTRQKVNKCLNKMHEIIMSGSRLSRCGHRMPWIVSLGFPGQWIPRTAELA